MKEWHSSVVRNAAGWAAIGTLAASRISRSSGSIRAGSCSQFAPTATAPRSAITSRTFGRRVAVAALGDQRPETHRGDDRQAAFGGRFQRDLHLRQMEKRLQNQKVDAGIFEQANLLGDVVARLAERVHPFALDQLRARHAAGHQGLVAGDFLRQFHRGEVDLLGLRPVAGPVQLLARAEKRQRLQHLRAGVEELAVQFAQRIGMLDGDLGRELAAAAAGADLLAAGAAVDVAAALQFDQIAAVADDRSLLDKFSDRFS